MLPDDTLSSEPVPGQFAEPAASRKDWTVDTEMGGVGLSNPSGGLRDRLWTLRYESPRVIVSAEGVPDTVLFEREGITELSLAFDQNMRPCVAFVDGDGPWLWWYDSQAQAQVFTALPAGATSPKVCTDEKRRTLLANSDIILAYLRDGWLCYRQQRDRFDTEYQLAPVTTGRLVTIGMNTGYRLQFKVYTAPDE